MAPFYGLAATTPQQHRNSIPMKHTHFRTTSSIPVIKTAIDNNGNLPDYAPNLVNPFHKIPTHLSNLSSSEFSSSDSSPGSSSSSSSSSQSSQSRGIAIDNLVSAATAAAEAAAGLLQLQKQVGCNSSCSNGCSSESSSDESSDDSTFDDSTFDDSMKSLRPCFKVNKKQQQQKRFSLRKRSQSKYIKMFRKKEIPANYKRIIKRKAPFKYVKLAKRTRVVFPDNQTSSCSSFISKNTIVNSSDDYSSASTGSITESSLGSYIVYNEQEDEDQVIVKNLSDPGTTIGLHGQHEFGLMNLLFSFIVKTANDNKQCDFIAIETVVFWCRKFFREHPFKCDLERKSRLFFYAFDLLKKQQIFSPVTNDGFVMVNKESLARQASM
jgi:hypothetical protein